MSSLTIHGKDYELARLLSGGDFAFVIPEYQRPYAWTIEHAEELLSDLLAMMGDDEPHQSPFPLTTEVLSEAEWTPEVVRGRQHRLVSTLARAWHLD